VNRSDPGAADRRARLTVGLAVRLAVALSCVAGCDARQGASAPDIELAWDGGGAPGPVLGAPGDQVSLGFRLRNSGSGTAYRATVRALTQLGSVQPPLHFVPAPPPGREVFGAAKFALAEGQSEICLKARLVRRTRGEIGETKLDNNRICRPILVRAPEAVNPTNTSGGEEYD